MPDVWNTVKRLPHVNQLAARFRFVEAEQAVLTARIDALAAKQSQLSAQLAALAAQPASPVNEARSTSAALVAVGAEQAAKNGAGPVPTPALPPSPFEPGHYYSPIPLLDDVLARADVIWPDPPPRTLPGIDLNEPGQLALLDQLAAYYDEQPFGDSPRFGLRYGFKNDFYSYGDALYLYSMLRHLRPRRVIEVGSGHSSAVTLDTVDRFMPDEAVCTFIEPEPARLYSLLTPTDRERVEIIERPVQDVPLERFEELGERDILFIDGSHVAKIGGDVNYVYFEVLPRLRSGVHVHIHDVFYPFEYPRWWVEKGFVWSEDYLLRAFLMYNPAFEIALFGDYLARFHRDRLTKLMPLSIKNTGGSLWLRRT